ncbi:MAG TPA: hypothetical protein VKB88_11655 [Bryobacteraceae bacterium]|nr:hypothetical protein [Bryobacteraceae bacterium]
MLLACPKRADAPSHISARAVVIEGMTPFHVRGTLGLAALCAYPPAPALAADPALSIYNQNFAVVREILPLDPV